MLDRKKGEEFGEKDIPQGINVEALIAGGHIEQVGKADDDKKEGKSG